MIESFATINFKLGDRSLWRKASILSDCCLLIAQEDPTSFTGHALIDEVCPFSLPFLPSLSSFSSLYVLYHDPTPDHPTRD